MRKLKEQLFFALPIIFLSFTLWKCGMFDDNRIMVNKNYEPIVFAPENANMSDMELGEVVGKGFININLLEGGDDKYTQSVLNYFNTIFEDFPVIATLDVKMSEFKYTDEMTLSLKIVDSEGRTIVQEVMPNHLEYINITPRLGPDGEANLGTVSINNIRAGGQITIYMR